MYSESLETTAGHPVCSLQYAPSCLDKDGIPPPNNQQNACKESRLKDKQAVMLAGPTPVPVESRKSSSFRTKASSKGDRITNDRDPMIHTHETSYNWEGTHISNLGVPATRGCRAQARIRP